MNTNNNQDAPHISVITQCIKDFSFENPNAPSILAEIKSAPEIDLSLDLKAQALPEENLYEVEIAIEASAQINNKKLFIVDLRYSGIFQMINIPEEQREMLLAVHCPSILFPFARKIIADVTQGGGFQPLMIDPIDFGALYSKKLAENNQEE